MRWTEGKSCEANVRFYASRAKVPQYIFVFQKFLFLFMPWKAEKSQHAIEDIIAHSSVLCHETEKIRSTLATIQ